MDKKSGLIPTIAELSATGIVESDTEFNKSSPKDKHETAYTDILDAYKDNIKSTLAKKSTYKPIIFWLSFSFLLIAFLMVLILVISFVFWQEPLFDDTIELCAVIIPALASFLTVFFVIPKVVTEYLFNTEEEKYMSEIIKSIQNYDKDQ